MTPSSFLRTALVCALFGLAASPASATVVFSDGFEDGDVSDWTVSTNYPGTIAVTVRDDIMAEGAYAMHIYLEAPPDGTDLVVRATHAFEAPSAGDYLLNLFAHSSKCSGCTISYDVLVDGTLLDRTFAPIDFEARSFDLLGLSAGTHTVSLGMHTTNASSGRFSASFDGLAISTVAVPEPATYALLLGGLGLVFAARRRKA